MKPIKEGSGGQRNDRKVLAVNFGQQHSGEPTIDRVVALSPAEIAMRAQAQASEVKHSSVVKADKPSEFSVVEGGSTTTPLGKTGRDGVWIKQSTTTTAKVTPDNVWGRWGRAEKSTVEAEVEKARLAREELSKIKTSRRSTAKLALVQPVKSTDGDIPPRGNPPSIA